jgi:hypothetical protein
MTTTKSTENIKGNGERNTGHLRSFICKSGCSPLFRWLKCEEGNTAFLLSRSILKAILTMWDFKSGHVPTLTHKSAFNLSSFLCQITKCQAGSTQARSPCCHEWETAEHFTFKQQLLAKPLLISVTSQGHFWTPEFCDDLSNSLKKDTAW